MRTTRRACAGVKMPLSIPKPSLPQGGRPMPQRTGVSWRVTEDRNWKPFSVDVKEERRRSRGGQRSYSRSQSRDGREARGYHTQQQQQPRSAPAKKQEKRGRWNEDEDRGVTKRMPLNDYLRTPLRPGEWDGLETDADRIVELPSPQTLQDEFRASRGGHADAWGARLLELAQGGRRGARALQASPPSKCAAVELVEAVDPMWLQKAADVGSKAGGAGRGPWAVVLVETHRPWRDLSKAAIARCLREQGIDVDDDGIVLNEGFDAAALGTRRGAALRVVQFVSVALPAAHAAASRGRQPPPSSADGLAALLRRVLGAQVTVVASGLPTPHPRGAAYGATLTFKGLASSEDAVDDALHRVRDTGVPNYFSPDDCALAVESVGNAGVGGYVAADTGGAAADPDEVTDVTKLLLTLLWQSLQRGDRGVRRVCALHPRKWSNAVFTDSPCDGVGGVILKNLYAAEFVEGDVYEQLHEQGVVALVAAHTAAALWNRTLRWRLPQGAAALPGETVRQGDGVAFVTEPLANGAADLVIPVYGALRAADEDRMPVFYSEFTRGALQDIGITLPFPLTDASAPPGFPLSMAYRRAFIPLPSLDWTYSRRAVTVSHTQGTQGVLRHTAPTALADSVETCLAPSTGATAVLRCTVPVDVSLGTLLQGLALA